MSLFRHLLICLALASTPLARASIPPSRQQAACELGRQILEAQIGSENKTFGAWIRKEVDAYDLTKEAHKAFDGLGEDSAFLKFMEKHGINMNTPAPTNAVQLTLEYMGGSTNFRPAIVSWLTLIFGFEAPWETAQPLYLKVAAERPNDFLPKAVTLTRAVRTPQAMNQWFGLFKATYASASQAKERSACLILLPAHAAYASTLPGGEDHLRQVSAWLDDLEKKETPERLPAIREINFIKFAVAFARKDYASAAKLARGSRVRAMEPLLLLLAGKVQEAATSLNHLKQDSTLSQQEKGLLDSTAALLKMNEGTKAK